MMMLLLNDIRDGGRRNRLLVNHHPPPPLRLVRSRRTPDEHAPQALLKKARFNEVLQQCSAHLPVEACHLRGFGVGELCAGVHEQIPDPRERSFDTSRLEWLRHVCCCHSVGRSWQSVNETERRVKPIFGAVAEISSRITPPPSCRFFDEGDARQPLAQARIRQQIQESRNVTCTLFPTR